MSFVYALNEEHLFFTPYSASAKMEYWWGNQDTGYQDRCEAILSQISNNLHLFTSLLSQRNQQWKVYSASSCMKFQGTVLVQLEVSQNNETFVMLFSA
jgi:hypothetical protein